jgi:hypothetical protein
VLYGEGNFFNFKICDMDKKISDFLNHPSCKGFAWLTTQDGRIFLKSFHAIPWLISKEGMNWLESPKGKKWLVEPGLELDKFFNENETSLMLLQLDNVQDRLLTEEEGIGLLRDMVTIGFDCDRMVIIRLRKPDGAKVPLLSLMKLLSLIKQSI